MNSLPDEMLEMVIRATDAKSIATCRQVCRHWNVLSARLFSENVTATGFESSEKVESFIQLISNRIQDFPFSKFKLNGSDQENIKSLTTLFQTCSEHIREVDMGYVKYASHELAQLHEELMARLAATPRLHVLTTGFEGKYFTGSVFSSLRELRLERCQPEKYLPPLESMPNLQILDFKSFSWALNYKHPEECFTWPFPAEYKTIREIKLRHVDLGIALGNDSHEETLTTVLADWTNVKICAFRLNRYYSKYWTSTVSNSWIKSTLTKVLALQANYVESLCIGNPGRSYNRARPTLAFSIPVLLKLRKLEIEFENSSPIEPINEICFPSLEHIQIKSLRMPTFLLPSSAVFRHVKSLRFDEYDEKRFWKKASPTLPNIGIVFPNLQEFEYSFVTGYHREPDLDVISHIICSMRLNSLQKLKFDFMLCEGYYATDLGLAANRRFYQIFSGFDDVEKVAEDAGVAVKNNMESSYWEEKKKVRLPSLVECNGLLSLELNWPLSEDFVQCVLLRMRPVRNLSVCLHQVSDGTLHKLKTIHGCDIKITVK